MTKRPHGARHLPERGKTAVITPVPADRELAVSMDTLVGGVHFPPDTSPADIGYKSLAVNLSDLAAMGAEPDFAAVSLSVPALDEAWLSAFEHGTTEIGQRHGVRILTEEIANGPLSVTIAVYGYVPVGAALRRGAAEPDDLVYVTGTLGDAGLALASRNGEVVLPGPHKAAVETRLARPSPRVDEGVALRGIASAAIDISDGLAADLGHVSRASAAGATIELERLPLSAPLARNVDRQRAWRIALTSGDDYELCFTVPPDRQKALERVARRFSCPIVRIGIMEVQPGIRFRKPDGAAFSPGPGYRHFG